MLFPSAFRLREREKGRTHRRESLEAGAGSVMAVKVKGDCANKRRDIVLLMAVMLSNSGLEM